MKIYTILVTNQNYTLVMDDDTFTGDNLDELLSVLNKKGIDFNDFKEVITTEENKVFLYVEKPEIKSISTEVTQNLFTKESVYRTVTEFFDNSVLMKEYSNIEDMEKALAEDLRK